MSLLRIICNKCGHFNGPRKAVFKDYGDYNSSIQPISTSFIPDFIERINEYIINVKDCKCKCHAKVAD